MSELLNRIEIKLESESIKPLSGWQLQEFMYNINKGYTKLDLINEISRLINEGENPENIIIINKSYDINNSYSYFRKSQEYDLGKSKVVEKLYNLGRPISMFPNRKIKKIEIIFNLYENLYTLFRANNINRIPKKELKRYVELSFYDAIKEIKEDANSIIDSLKFVNTNKPVEIKEKLNKYLEKARLDYDNFIEDQNNINKFNSIIDKELIQLTNDEKSLHIDMDQKYYNRFYRCLKKVDRPIILIYNNINNTLRLVKKEYMLNDVESENFLDYKDYSHNSPFVITIAAGSMIAIIVLLLYKGSKQEKLNMEQKQKNDSKEKDIDNDIEDLIHTLSNSPELNQVKNIENKFINHKLNDLNEKTKKNLEKTLKQKSVTKGVVSLEKYKEIKKSKK